MKSTNPHALRGRPTKIRPGQVNQQVSSFACDVSAIHYAVNDTVVEVRGDHPIYRPGYIVWSLHGAVFYGSR